MVPSARAVWVLAATSLLLDPAESGSAGEPGGGRPSGRSAGPLPAVTPAIVLEPVVVNLASPVYVTHADDGSDRLFIVEQAGVIKVLRPGSSAPAAFLDISDRVLFGGERGLLGLAFHPDFATTGRFFVNYTRRPDGATVIAEYRRSATNPDIGARDESVLLTVAQPYANHNGGMIEFGPDGNLYIALGDGGSANDPGDRAQNVDELLGKILRIDVDVPASPSQPYSSPADNPFAGPTPGRDEIYALGFRNPWRFSFDRQTGDLLAGDVGQGAREEIDLVVRGGNYGWRTFEGTLCTGLDPGPCDPSGFVMPIAEYQNAGARCAVTGGYAYRGRRGGLPFGGYLFGDYCSGELFLLDNGQFGAIASTGLRISSFGEDEEGELYVVDHGGAVFRVTATSSCSFTISPSGIAISAVGGAGTVEVTTDDGCAWTASTSNGWITINAGSSGNGDGLVLYDVAANSDLRSRSGSVMIADQTHTVIQAGRGRCPLAIDPRRVRVGAKGGTGSVTVAAGDGCSWVATSPVAWIAIASGGNGTGSGTVTYRVDPNPTGQWRRARLSIGGRALLIRQR